jgi:putative hydrolase of the HAD superfamily
MCLSVPVTSSVRPQFLGGVVLALDIDGVLLDPHRGGRGPWAQALAEDYGVDAARLRPAFFRKGWRDILAGRIDIEVALAAAIEEMGWTLDVREMLQRWFEADFVVDYEVVDAVRGWVADGARLVLVTNQEHQRAAFLRERLGEQLPVSGFAYSAAVGFLKDDPRFYPAASQLLGLPPHDPAVVFVDDSLKNVETARDYGWTGVHFVRHANWREEISSALTRVVRQP